MSEMTQFEMVLVVAWGVCLGKLMYGGVEALLTNICELAITTFDNRRF